MTAVPIAIVKMAALSAMGTDLDAMVAALRGDDSGIELRVL